MNMDMLAAIGVMCCDCGFLPAFEPADALGIAVRLTGVGRMGKKRKTGILGRHATPSKSTHVASVIAKDKPVRRETLKTSESTTSPGSKHHPALSSPLQQQCAIIVTKLLNGVKQRRSSGSLKTLCLAPNIKVGFRGMQEK
jgi:hypothetical protein